MQQVLSKDSEASLGQTAAPKQQLLQPSRHGKFARNLSHTRISKARIQPQIQHAQRWTRSQHRCHMHAALRVQTAAPKREPSQLRGAVATQPACQGSNAAWAKQVGTQIEPSYGT